VNHGLPEDDEELDRLGISARAVARDVLAPVRYEEDTMSISKRSEARSPAGTVHCVRVDAPRALAEHEACPYCFGRGRDVESGDRQRFCDYERERDPVVFGFPQGLSRFDA
jgi:hypothetical protein